MTESALVIDCVGEPMLGVLHRGVGSERTIGILVVVGGPQYRVGSHRQFVQMARHWAAAGYPVLRFDYRGMGDSGGEPRNFEVVDEDIRAAVDAFFANVATLQGVVVFGLCDAASAGMIYGASDARVRGLIAANPWARTAAGEAASLVRHYYGARLLQWSFWRKLLAGELQIGRSIREFTGSWRLSRRAAKPARAAHFLDRMRLGLGAFDGPVLVLISDDDLTAAEFQDLCRDSAQWRRTTNRSNVSTVGLTAADHTYSKPGSLRKACEAVLGWLDRSQFGRH